MSIPRFKCHELCEFEIEAPDGQVMTLRGKFDGFSITHTGDTFTREGLSLGEVINERYNLELSLSPTSIDPISLLEEENESEAFLRDIGAIGLAPSNRFPHICPRCGGAAYIDATAAECEKNCGATSLLTFYTQA